MFSPVLPPFPGYNYRSIWSFFSPAAEHRPSFLKNAVFPTGSPTSFPLECRLSSPQQDCFFPKKPLLSPPERRFSPRENAISFAPQERRLLFRHDASFRPPPASRAAATGCHRIRPIAVVDGRTGDHGGRSTPFWLDFRNNARTAGRRGGDCRPGSSPLYCLVPTQ